jgi:hypothetical protein
MVIKPNKILSGHQLYQAVKRNKCLGTVSIPITRDLMWLNTYIEHPIYMYISLNDNNWMHHGVN